MFYRYEDAQASQMERASNMKSQRHEVDGGRRLPDKLSSIFILYRKGLATETCQGRILRMR